MRLSRFSLHFVSALAVATSAPASPPIVLQGHSIVPPGWSLHRRAERNVTIPLKIALKQSNVENLESYLMDVGDPASPNYGKYWTRQKVAEVFRPSSESVNVVHSWLVDDHGVDPTNLRLGHDSGVLYLDVTVAEAEDILAAEYYVFRHSDGTEEVGIHQRYHLPEHVAKHMDLVFPTLRLGGAPRPNGVAPMPMPTSDNGTILINHDASQCDAAVTLECLRELYNFNYTLVSRDKNSIAVNEYEGESYKGSDLDLFFRTFSPNQVGRRPTLVSISGGQLNETSNDKIVLEESDMDLQLIMGLLPLQDVLLYQVQRSSPRIGGYLDDDTLGALDADYCKKAPGHLKDCGNKPSAHVVSISYGTPDIYDFDLTPALDRQCLEIGKLTLAGMTFVASSGDAGVAWGKPSDNYCVVNGTFKGGSPQTGYFIPTFPASCPYVTAVGATQVANGRTVRDPETATTSFPSGGGFSSNFLRQAWQDAQVADYLSKHDPKYAQGVFERTGRGYPDVAANGYPIVSAVAGQLILMEGTSASAPIVASLIAAVNDARIARGKGPVGFINPALYSDQFKGVFNDITIGSNPGCGTPGFQAASGWDPVTGLGTLNFERLLEQFLALP